MKLILILICCALIVALCLVGVYVWLTVQADNRDE